MKKTLITLSALFLMASSTVFAQDGDKKQEPKQEPKKEKKEEKPGGTRMAINEKGLPGKGTKKGHESTQKTSGSSTTTAAADKK